MATSNVNNEVKVEELLKNIKENLTQKSASYKDEVKVMKAMLSDDSFEVSVYSNKGVEKHNPAKEFKSMVSGIVAATTKISKEEAETLTNNYDVKKSDAETMVNLSKDFLNTALRTGRKINLGGTANSDISIQIRELEQTTKRYPKKVGVNADGTPKYENQTTTVPAHNTLKVTSPCPKWAK